MGHSKIITLNASFKNKIKSKLKKIFSCFKYWESNIVWTIIHGCFTRSNVFIKLENEDYSTKLINFERVKFGSPAIDFGRIFLTNLPNEDDVSKLETLFWIMMQSYLEEMEKEYPQVTSELVKQDIVNNMIYSYVNLNDEEIEAIENHIPILYMINNIGSFA